MNFLSILNKPRFISDKVVLRAAGWRSSSTLPLPVISDLKKKREGKKKKKAFGKHVPTHTHTHTNIYTEAGAGATLNPLQRCFFFLVSLIFFFLLELKPDE